MKIHVSILIKYFKNNYFILVKELKHDYIDLTSHVTKKNNYPFKLRIWDCEDGIRSNVNGNTNQT